MQLFQYLLLLLLYIQVYSLPICCSHTMKLKEGTCTTVSKEIKLLRCAPYGYFCAFSFFSSFSLILFCAVIFSPDDALFLCHDSNAIRLCLVLGKFEGKYEEKKIDRSRSGRKEKMRENKLFLYPI